MARNLHSDFDTAVQAAEIHPSLLCKIETSGGDLLVWTGAGELVYGGDTYLGTGNFMGISQVSERTDLSANGVSFSLSGIPSAFISTALGQVQHGRPCQLWMALLNISTRALINNPYELFAGFSDVTVITEQAQTSTISIMAENRLVDLERPRIRRYTDEDQKSDTANALDIGFEFVPKLQDKTVKFGSG